MAVSIFIFIFVYLTAISIWRSIHFARGAPHAGEVASGFDFRCHESLTESGVHIDMNPGAPSFYFFI